MTTISLPKLAAKIRAIFREAEGLGSGPLEPAMDLVGLFAGELSGRIKGDPRTPQNRELAADVVALSRFSRDIMAHSLVLTILNRYAPAEADTPAADETRKLAEDRVQQIFRGRFADDFSDGVDGNP